MDGHPLAMLHDEIMGSVDAGFYSLPIFMAAAIPDICSALEAEDGRAKHSRYKSWFERWVASRMSLISADDCYNLRCGLVHQGRLGQMPGSVNQVVFLLPNAIISNFSNNRFDNTYMYAVVDFCKDMVGASCDWWIENSNNSVVLHNSESVLKLHRSGYGNSIQGVPVLA